MAGKQRFTRRTASALADSARDRAMIARRKTMARVLGHKRHCPDCGKTARTADQVAACRDKHKRAPKARTGPARGKTGPDRGNPIGSGWGKAKAPSRGHISCGGCGGTHRNHLDSKKCERRREETENRTKKRNAERDRRSEAVKSREARGGRPKGTPKTRDRRKHTTKLRTPEDRAEFHAHMQQHAAGRVDRDGNRVPHEPSPRKVRPRERVEPKVR